LCKLEFGQPEALPFHEWSNVYFVGEVVALAALAVEVPIDTSS